MRARLAQLRDRHDAALDQAHRSLAGVRNFTDLRGDARAWTLPIEA